MVCRGSNQLVIDVDDDDCTYEVYYCLDDEKILHDSEWDVRHLE